MNQQEKAARQARADELVSDIYERIGPGKGLTVKQVNYLFGIMGPLVQGKQAGGARGTFRWQEASGDLLDPEGDVAGTWFVKTYPNGNGAATLTVNRRLTRAERDAEVARLLAERDDLDAMMAELVALQPERQADADEAKAKRHASYADKIAGVEMGFKVW